MKKIISLLLSIILAMTCMSFFVGCGELIEASINWNVDLSKPIDMKLLFPASGLPNFGKDHTAQLIEQSTGYKAEYVEVADGSADNEINNFLSTQSEYHAMKLTQAQYDPYVREDTWLDLTELLERTESGKKLYELIDLMPGAWDSVTYTDANGKKGIYGIPETGYSVMEDYALVWNKVHLTEVGWFDDHDEVPESIGEVTDAMYRLQEHYGPKNSNYHAFGIGGSNSAYVENIMCAFECPNQFFIDGNGKVQLNIYHEGLSKYVTYMNKLWKDKIISDSWQLSSSEDISSQFAGENSSVIFTTYWWVSPLAKTMVAKGLPAKYGMANTYDAARDNILSWRTRVRGDGTNGSVNQTKAKHIYDDAGIAYITVIPFYMAENAVYTIDYFAKKLENYALFYGGKEGVDWIVVDEPADGKENFKEKIIYMQPWSYEFNGVTKTGGGKWIQLTDNYIKFIVDNSMYASGANVVEARSLFHLRETGFDAWQVTVPKDETIITSPMRLMPTFDNWSPISIQARTMAKRGVASAIDAQADPVEALNITRRSLLKKFTPVSGVKYYWWSDDISNEMTEWYNNINAK